MKTTNHSPKPWRIWQNRVAPNQTEIEIYDAQNYKLANIAHWKDEGGEESKANANLIASAPDLLSALEWALGQIEDDLCPDHQAALDGCRAAIAKAKGEA
jgi:hypothetical protein